MYQTEQELRADLKMAGYTSADIEKVIAYIRTQGHSYPLDGAVAVDMVTAALEAGAAAPRPAASPTPAATAGPATPLAPTPTATLGTEQGTQAQRDEGPPNYSGPSSTAPATSPAPPTAPVTRGGTGPGAGEKQDLVQMARDAARRAGINEDLFVRQIYQESGFNPRARGAAGEVGLGQINPAAHPDYMKSVTDPYDPQANLDYAAKLMAGHLRTYGGDYAKAASAYNAPALTAKSLAETGELPAGTRGYVNNIVGTQRTEGLGTAPAGDVVAGPPNYLPPSRAMPSQVTNVDQTSGRPPAPGVNPETGKPLTTSWGAPLEVRPFGTTTPDRMTSQESKYFFPWDRPEAGGLRQAIYNTMTQLGLNAEGGTPYSSFMEGLLPNIYQTTGIKRALLGQEDEANPYGAFQSDLMDTTRSGRTSAIEDYRDAAGRMAGIARSTPEQLSALPESQQRLYQEMSARGGEGSVDLLAALLEPAVGPFLRRHIRAALQSQLLRGRQQEPNTSPMEFLSRSYLPATRA